MRFLITGASGWVGFALTHHLSKLYGKKNIQLILSPKSSHEKEVKRRSILVQEGFDIIINDILKDNMDIEAVKPFDVLFHLAAFTETETKSQKVHVNDIGTKRMLNSLKPLLKGRHIVYTSSITTVDRSHPDNTPLAENHPCNPRTAYGLSKLRGEKIIKEYAADFGYEWTILRIPTLYGPGYRPGGMFDVIEKSLRNRTLEARLPWPGHLSLIYLDDLIRVLKLLGTKKYKRNEIYHIGSGEYPTYDEIISKIAEIIGVKRNKIPVPNLFWALVRFIVWLPGLLHILPFKLRIATWRISLIVTDGLVSDNSKLKRVLPFKYTPLEKGLPLTYKKII